MTIQVGCIKTDFNPGGKVIVTGATGFVGRYVVSNLMKGGYEVIALVRDIKKAKSLPYLDGALLVEFDITNPHFLFENHFENSKLIHCAWGDVRDHFSLAHIDEHFLNSYRFIQAAVKLGVSSVVVTGTSWEYGKNYGPINPTVVVTPNTPYAISKNMLHEALRALKNRLNFKLVWARLFYLHGDEDHPESLLSQFDKALDLGGEVFNMSLGEQLYDFLPVELGAAQLITLLGVDEGCYNICSAKPISLRRLLEERMIKRGKFIRLNLGHHQYREQDTIAIWGAATLPEQLKN